MDTKDFWCLVGLVLFTALLRVPAVAHIAFLHDEIIVTQAAVQSFERAVESGNWWGVLVDIPMKFSAAITPVWNWLQYLVTRILPLGEHPTRILPFACSFVPIILAYSLTRQYCSRWVAVGTAFAFSVSDVCLWTSVKSEMSEQLLVSCMIAALMCMLRTDRRSVFLGAMILGITPLTYLGKGLFIYALFTAWMTGRYVMKRVYWSQQEQIAPGNLAYSYSVLGLSLLPTLVWLAAALYRTEVLLSPDHTIRLAHVQSFLRDIYASTIGIFETGRAHGQPGANWILYTYLQAWPTSTLMAPFALIGSIVALIKLARGPVSRSHELFLVIALLGYAPFLYYTIKGYQGARYTVLYQYPFALSFAIGLRTVVTWLFGSFQQRLLGYAVAVGILCYDFLMVARISYLVVMFDWGLLRDLVLYGGGGFLASGVAAEVLFWKKKDVRLHFVPVLTCLLLISSLAVYYFSAFGPNYWGTFQGWGIQEDNLKTFESQLLHDRMRGLK